MTSHPAPPAGVQGITEADIAQYLANNPAFFERHAELLASVQLRSPHGQRAVSLQERQMEMLRERIKGLEGKIIEMIRHGQDNLALADRLHRFTRGLLATVDEKALPARIIATLQHEFQVPQVALRTWHADDADIDDDVKSFAASLGGPYCGANAGFDAAGWLDEPEAVASLAMLPLRHAQQPGTAFGLLVLGSPDPTRYTAEMGTEFLARLGDTVSAALARLHPAS